MTPKQIGAFAIGPVGSALLGLITLPVITWFFPQEDVGRMAMLQVTLGFSILLFSLGLDQSYVREFHESEDKPALLKMAMLPGLLLLTTTILLLLASGGTLAGWLFGEPLWHLSLLVALAILSAFIARFLSLVLRMSERGLAFSMSQLLPKLLLLGIVLGYVMSGADKSLTNLVLANVLAVAFVCVIFGWNTRTEWLASLQTRMDVSELGRMLRFGLPLILGGLAFWGLTAVDKVFLRNLASFEELGVYAVAVSFAAAATILQSVFSTVWAPVVYKWASSGSGLEKVHKVSRYILAVVVLGFSLTGLLSWVIPVFLPAEYIAVQWLVVSCLGFPLLYTLSETTVVGIGVARRTSLAMVAAVVAFVVNVVGNWLLIPVYGSAGAAVSTCISFWIFFLLRTEFSIYLSVKFSRKLLYSYTLAVVFGASTYTLLGKDVYWWMVIYWGAILLSCFWVFKEEIGEVKRLIRRAL